MNGEYNIWNKWDKLKTVMLGDCYGPAFFQDIKNKKIRSALTRIAEETQEDLENFKTVLEDFGCEVIRPQLDKNDSIINYINDNGQVRGSQGVPPSPLQPRNCQLVLGNELFYTSKDHASIKQCLDNYNKNYVSIKEKPWSPPLSEQSFLGYKGNNAPNWPSYEQYVNSCRNNMPISDDPALCLEFEHLHAAEAKYISQVDDIKKFPIPAPSITLVGKDIYVDKEKLHLQMPEWTTDDDLDFYLDQFAERFNKFRLNSLVIGGHNDGTFHTLKPGVILSLKEIQHYANTFPDWEVCYLEHQGWAKVEGFTNFKKQVFGKWWVPGQEENDEFTRFVETWLKDWVGYVEETVFDVNVLMLDQHHCCVSNPNNPIVNQFLKKHNIEPVHVPWRHRYFWDGGLHCITLDLYREGSQQNYFPDRKTSISDIGFD